MGPSGTCKIQRFADGVLLGPDRFGFLGEKRAGDQSLRFEVGADGGAESDQPGDENRKIKLARDWFDGRDLTRKKGHWYIAISQSGYRGQADIEHLDALGICRRERSGAENG